MTKRTVDTKAVYEVQQEPPTSQLITVSAPYVVWRALPEGEDAKLYKWWAATSSEVVSLATAHREAHVRFKALFHYPPKYVLRLGLLFLAGPILDAVNHFDPPAKEKA